MSMLLVLISCLSVTLVSSSLLVFPETSENYTYVELGLQINSNEAHFPLLQIDKWNMKVFHVETHLPRLIPTCAEEKRSPPQMIYWKKPKSLRMCPAVATHSFGNYYSVGVYTHFYQVDTLVISGLINGEAFKTTQPLKNLIPREMSYVLFPYTIQEGMKYYEIFGEPQMQRKLAFRPTKPRQISIGSYERSGTHLLLRTMEEITGEFIRTFPNMNGSLWSQTQHTEAGELRGFQAKNYSTPAYLTHDLLGLQNVFKFSRQIIILRNPLVSADSNFHMRATNYTHTCKKGGDYLNSVIYSKYIKWRTHFASNNIEERKDLIYSQGLPTVIVRYEDLLADPLEVMMTVISFYAGVPAEVSFKQKIERLIENNGLTTFYRKEKEQPKVSKQEPTIAKLDKYPLDLVNYTLIHSSNIMEEFGYIEVYQERLNKRVTPSPRVNGLLKFQLQNQEIMEMMLKYRFDPTRIKHKLKQIPVEKRIQLVEISYKEFNPTVKMFPTICPDGD